MGLFGVEIFKLLIYKHIGDYWWAIFLHSKLKYLIVNKIYVFGACDVLMYLYFLPKRDIYLLHNTST